MSTATWPFCIFCCILTYLSPGKTKYEVFYGSGGVTNCTFSKHVQTFTQCSTGYVDDQVCVYIVPQPVERRVEPILSIRFSSLQNRYDDVLIAKDESLGNVSEFFC